jgi:ubiquinone/menaquinone biosynthesis C-methylase UbiE
MYYTCGETDLKPDTLKRLKIIRKEWSLKMQDPQANIAMWDSMARGFGERMPADSSAAFQEDQFLGLLEKEAMFGPDSTVLDVGCGTGKYALALACRCRKITGIDISPRMLDIARQKAGEMGFTNVDFRLGDWNDLDITAAGFTHSFDLVFAHMSPAVQSAAAFEKMIRAGRGWGVLSKHIHRSDSVFAEVKRIAGISESGGSDQDMIYAFELLWRQGILPRLSYESRQWDMEKTEDEAQAYYLNRAKTYGAVSPEKEKSINAYLASIAKNGLVCEKVDSIEATLYWHL